jgi:hypothetical protein
MEYVIGSLGALAVGLFATLSGFDRGRAFYATVLIIVGSYYVLFAAMAGETSALGLEIAAWALFFVLAVIGFKRTPWLVAAGLIAHGLLDVVHGDLIANPGVPAWWPGFCMSYDVAAGLYLAALLIARDSRRASFRAAIRPAVETELRLAEQSDKAGDAARSFRHLERAHVLSQASTAQHVRVHFRMLVWGLRYRSTREVAGQAFRLIGAAALTVFNRVPTGNTGGSNVSAFRSMPISDDLAQIIALARDPRPRGRLDSHV